MCLKAGIGLLVGRSVSGWGGGPRAGVSLLVGWTGTQRVLGLVLACRMVGWVLVWQGAGLWWS